jgi:spermidine synthase
VAAAGFAAAGFAETGFAETGFAAAGFAAAGFAAAGFATAGFAAAGLATAGFAAAGFATAGFATAGFAAVGLAAARLAAALFFAAGLAAGFVAALAFAGCFFVCFGIAPSMKRDRATAVPWATFLAAEVPPTVAPGRRFIAAEVVRTPVLEFEVLDHTESPVGVLILRRRTAPVDGVIELTLEHQFLMSSAVTVSERELATRAIEMHGGTNLDVLVGGLGLGYTAKAALESSSVARVDVIELVPGIIQWFERGLIPLGKEVTADPRFHAIEDDVFERLGKAPTRLYDLLLIDVDHNPDERLGETSDSFYARGNLAVVARHLKPGGVFALWSTASNPAFEAELRAVFGQVRVDAIDFFNETTGADETNWLFLAMNPAIR